MKKQVSTERGRGLAGKIFKNIKNPAPKDEPFLSPKPDGIRAHFQCYGVRVLFMQDRKKLIMAFGISMNGADENKMSHMKFFIYLLQLTH